MPEDNVEIVRRGFTATIEGDWQTALATLDREAEIHDFDTLTPGRITGTTAGSPGLRTGARAGTPGGSRTWSFARPGLTA